MFLRKQFSNSLRLIVLLPYFHNTKNTLINLGFFYCALTYSILLQVFDRVEQRVKPIATILNFL